MTPIIAKTEWPERLVGRKAIQNFFSWRYGIETWIGCRNCILQNHIPLRRTFGGKPVIIIEEILRFEKKTLAKILLS